MLYIKTFEDVNSNIDKTYHSNDPKTFNFALRDAQSYILNQMDPNPVDLWYDIDDYLLEIKDQYGKFTDKYGVERKIIYFDDVDIKIDIGDSKYYYSIANICNYKFVHGNTIQLSKANVGLSTHGEFDREFYKWFLKNKNNLNPFYSILIGFERDYLQDNSKEELLEKAKQLTKSLSNMLKRISQNYSTKIINLESLGIDSDWKKLHPSFESLLKIDTPLRISMDFSINKK